MSIRVRKLSENVESTLNWIRWREENRKDVMKNVSLTENIKLKTLQSYIVQESKDGSENASSANLMVENEISEENISNEYSRAFRCDECGNRYSNSHALKRHMQSHLG